MIDKPKTKEQIIKELRKLSIRMKESGLAMQHPDFEEFIAFHGEQMHGAGIIAEKWADSWEAENGTGSTR